MGSVNKVVLVGNLGRDAELRYTAGGAPVSSFSLATTEVWNDKGGQRQEKTECTASICGARPPRACKEYLVKGKQISRRGGIQYREWTDKEGQKKTTTEIRGDRSSCSVAAAGARTPAVTREHNRCAVRAEDPMGSRSPS